MQNYLLNYLDTCVKCLKPIYGERVSDYHGECEVDYDIYHIECWEKVK